MARSLPRFFRSIRFQLLASVNVVLAVAISLFLVLDYRAELAERIAEKRIGLQEEAMTLARAIARLRHTGLDAVQAYIDDVCGRMREAQSPGHHIAVVLGNVTLQAQAHHRASAHMVEAMRRAAESASGRAKVDGHELVAGAYEEGDIVVYVSEYLTNVRARLHREYIYNEPVTILVLGGIAAVVLNLLLARLIVRPTRILAATIERIGRGELGIQTPSLPTTEYAYLSEAINEMSRRLEEADRRRRDEIARARRIQQHLLPSDLRLPGLELAALFRPAEAVAGDYYDALPCRDNVWFICVADVTGHGIPAAMIAAMLKVLVRHGADRSNDPAAVLGYVNRQLCELSLPDYLATMILLAWWPEQQVVRYASAGHEPALLWHDGHILSLEATGLLLGAIPEATYETRTLAVAAGDRMLLTTDGACETRAPNGELFGRQRLMRLFQSLAPSEPEEVVSELHSALEKHRGSAHLTDDLTLIAIKFGAPS